MNKSRSKFEKSEAEECELSRCSTQSGPMRKFFSELAKQLLELAEQLLELAKQLLELAKQQPLELA